MTTEEILQQLSQLPLCDRLTIAKAALTTTRTEWQTLTPKQKEQQLAMSAELAVLDYQPGQPLTEFTALDSEAFVLHI